jgi:orotate phosphoribosyltransferase
MLNLDEVIEKILQRGHFKLSSGLHSNIYFNTKELLKYPTLIDKMLDEYIKKYNLNSQKIDVIAGIAMGSICFAYHLALKLESKPEFIYFERDKVTKKLKLPKNINFPKNKNIYILEDVYTTGKTLLEVRNYAERYANVIGLGALIYRGEKNKKDIYMIDSLIDLETEFYEEKECHLCKNNVPYTYLSSK